MTQQRNKAKNKEAETAWMGERFSNIININNASNELKTQKKKNTILLNL